MKKIGFFGLPIIMMLFWACSSGTDTDSFWTYKSGMQVYWFNTMAEVNEDATLIMYGDGGTFYVGKIVKGKVYLEMPKTLDASYLTTEDDATISPTKMARFWFINVIAAGKDIGYLQYQKDIFVEGWAVEKELNQMYFWYYSNDCTVTSNESGQWNGITINVEYDLKVKKGWNAIYCKGAYDKNADPKNTTRLYTSNLSKIPADMKWVIKFW